MKRLTAEQVAAELERLRVPYLIDMELADAEGDTEDYEYNEHVAELLTKAIWLVRRNLIESPDERRERFERWYRQDCETRRGIFNRSMARDMRGVGEYRDENIETAWLAFNAALDFGGGGGE